MKEQEFTETDVLENNLKLKRFIKNRTSTNKANEYHMKTIQLEIDIIQKKIEINYVEINQDKFRIKEMQQVLTNKIRNVSIENNEISKKLNQLGVKDMQNIFREQK